METVEEKEEKGVAGPAVIDAGRELEVLRAEIEKNRGIFDSARLVVGHELNRPLTSINGYLDLLETRFEAESGEKEKRYFSRIHEAVAELEGLVESFIHMLRFDSPAEGAADFNEVDLYEMIEKLKVRYEGYAGGVDNMIPKDFQPVLVRRSCLEIVLDNLISNALKHGRSSEPVRVTAEVKADRRAVAKRDMLMIRVTDNGRGIPEREIKEIFDPFYRGNAGRDSHGLGLGLALVRNVMNIMMGNIHIESEQGKGTVATVCLPIPEDKPGPFERIG